MMQYSLILLSFLLLIGCTNEVDIDQPQYSSKIVVDGYIEQNQPAHIYLTLSSPYLTAYDSASIRATFVNYAKVTLTSSLGESEILTLYKQNSFFPPFVYKSVNIKGEIGETYSIKIEVYGKTITASTTIPQPPVVNNIIFDSQTDTSGYVKVQVHPDAEKDLYLFSQVKSIISGENMHPSTNPCFQLKAGAEPSELTILRSRETNLYLLYKSIHAYSGWPKYQYSKEDIVFVKIGAVDKQSFTVLKSLFTDQMSSENPFALNTNGIETNIEGGIGRWTGIANATMMVYDSINLHPLTPLYTKQQQ